MGKLKAAACARMIVKQKWHPAVLSRFEQSLKMGEKWGIACSGGGDSLCLLLNTFGHWQDYADQLIVLHYNHHIRGPAADHDAAFVEQVALELGIRCVVGHGSGKAKNEVALRDERQSFFKKNLQLFDLKGLLFGHHLDDAAETLLMRLSHGSGLEGLIAPRPMHFHGNKIYVRPFLNLRRSFLGSVLNELQIQPCLDATNLKPDYYRNIIRLSVLPLWESVADRCVAKGIVRSQSLLTEDANALSEWASRVWPERDNQLPFNLQVFKDLPRAIVRRLFYQLWPLIQKKAVCGDWSYSAKESFIDGLVGQKNGRYPLGKGWVVIQNNQIDYEAPHLDAVVFEPCVLKIGEILELSNGGVLELVHDEVSAIHLNSLQTCIYIPQDLATPYLTIRSWRPGDRYQPFGCLGTKKIKDQWIDYKIPKALRRTLPIICDASGVILWSPGLLPNEKIRLKNGQKCALRLTYQLKM